MDEKYLSLVAALKQKLVDPPKEMPDVKLTGDSSFLEKQPSKRSGIGAGTERRNSGPQVSRPTKNKVKTKKATATKSAVPALICNLNLPNAQKNTLNRH